MVDVLSEDLDDVSLVGEVRGGGGGYGDNGGDKKLRRTKDT